MPGDVAIDIDLAGWIALSDLEARRLAERIARAADARLVLLLPHAYRGRPMRLALFSRGDTLYSLVPGGEVTVGFDSGQFSPPAGPTEGYDPAQLVRLVAEHTTPKRMVTVPPVLAAVEAIEAGVTECPPDHPEIVRLMAKTSSGGTRSIEWHDHARAELSGDGAVTRAWLINRPTYDEAIAELA